MKEKFCGNTKLKFRTYQTEGDYWRIRDFLPGFM
jgi:hypothetical protein